MNDRQIYVDEVKLKIEQWNKNIDALEGKVELATAEMKSEYEKDIIALKLKRDEALVKLDELQNTTDTAWENVKDGFDRTWKSISQAAKSAKHKIFDKEGT